MHASVLTLRLGVANLEAIEKPFPEVDDLLMQERRDLPRARELHVDHLLILAPFDVRLPISLTKVKFRHGLNLAVVGVKVKSKNLPK